MTLSVISGLLLVCLIFFHQPLFSGEVINATDIITQQYFWNVFIKDNLLSDPTFQTWLPYINAGTPFSGGLNLIFRPITFLTLLIFPVHTGINYEIVIYLFLMGIFMYVYMRELQVTPIGSFLAALFLMLSGQIVTLMNAGHVNKIGAIFPTPLVFLALERALRRKTLRAFLLTAAALGFQFWQGHIQISFYICIAVGIYFVIRVGQFYRQEHDARQLVRLTAFAIVMVLIFLALSAVEFLPLLSFAKVSERAEGVSYEFATSWSMPPEELITYLIPGFFGFRRLNYIEDEQGLVEYWGRMPFTQTGHYLGLLPLLLAILAVCFVRNKHVFTLAILAAIVLILGMGQYIPIYKLLYEYVPGFDKFRVPQMILFLFAFAASGLAGFGADWLLVEFSDSKEKRLRIVLIVGVALSLAFWVITLLLPVLNQAIIRIFADALFRKGAAPETVIARYQNIHRGFLVFNGLFAISLCVLGLRLAKRVQASWIAAAIVLVFVGDIWWFDEKFIDTIPLENSHYVTENDAIRYCKEQPGFYRILPMTDTPVSYNVSNKFVAHQLYSVSGYEAVGVQYYNTYLGVMMNAQQIGSRLMDLLNIKYLILPKGVQFEEHPVHVGDVYGPYKIVMDSDAVLVENLNVLPRVFPVHHAVVLQHENDIFTTLLHPDFEPREIVVLEEPPDVTLPQRHISSSASTAEITHYFNRTIEVEAEMAADGFLVLSEKYYPGWKAYVDGENTNIYKADYTLQAVFVPQGKHTIVFAFQPTQYLRGLVITGIVLLGLGGGWIMQLRRRQQPLKKNAYRMYRDTYVKTRSFQLSCSILLCLTIIFIVLQKVITLTSGVLLYILLTCTLGIVILWVKELHTLIARLFHHTTNPSMYYNVLLTLCSVMFVVIGFEYYLQFNSNTSAQSHEQALLIPEEWKLRDTFVEGAQGANYWHGKLHVYNEAGMRRSTPFPPKRPDYCRIMVVGDSLTYGTGVDLHETYPARIEAELSEEYRLEVLNLGIGGIQSAEILDILQQYIPQLDPDIVVYGVCQNDFLETGEGQRAREDLEKWGFPLPERMKTFMIQHTLFGEFLEQRYDELLMRLGIRADFYNNILRDLYNYQIRFTRDVTVMNLFTVQSGLPPIVTMVLDQHPRVNSRGHRVTRKAEKILRLAGMDVILTREYYEKYNGREMKVSPWEGHPNAEAHRLFAHFLARTLRKHPVLQQYRK